MEVFEDKPSRGSPDVGSPLFSRGDNVGSPLFSRGDNALLVKSPLRDGDSGFFMVSLNTVYSWSDILNQFSVMYVNMHVVTKNTVDKEMCSTLSAVPSQCGALGSVIALVSSRSLYST
jgi:hypothetical protein